jgi:hypothetical protein
MKILILTTMLFGVLVCTQDKNITTITNFINSYFIQETSNTYLDKLSYIHYTQEEYESLTAKEKENCYQFFNMYFTFYHLELAKTSNQYQLYAHATIDKDLLKDYELQYKDYTNVYYMVVNNKIVTHFILNEAHKIISFCPYISFYSDDSKKEPVLLTKLRYNK